MNEPEHRWTWVGREQDDRKALLLAAKPQALQLDADRLCAALSQAANDSLLIAAVWGYAAGALELIAADPWLVRKQYVWAAPPEQAAALVRDLEAADLRLLHPVQVHVCRDRWDLVEVFAAFGLNLGLIVFDEDEKAVADIQRQRVRVGARSAHRFDRTLHDLHLLAERCRHPIKGIPLGSLRNLHAGRAALCVAAGPSLDRRLDFLRQHQDRAVVIAADLVAHRLESEGVRVDFIVSVDTGDIIRQRCHRPLNPQAVAILPLACDRRMDDIFVNRSYFWVEPECSAVLAQEDSPPSGTNVGSAVMGMAFFLGCTQAVLVGHDLSFTPDRLYSSCVDKKDDLEQLSLRDFRSRMLEIPGNGGPVSSNTQFVMAIEDMGALVSQHPETVVYNPNINDASGARIVGTNPVPEGWAPPDVPAPKLPASLDLPLRLKDSFAAEVEGQCLEFEHIISAGLDAGRPLMEVCNEAWAKGEQLPWAIHLAEPLLGGFEPFCLSELTRPIHEQQAGIMDEAAASLRMALPAWFRLCRQAVDADPVLPERKDQRVAEMMARLFCSAPAPVRSSLQEALVPLFISTWVDLAIWLPEYDFPLPAKLPEAVTVVGQMGARATQRVLDRILSMCVVEGSEVASDIVAQARHDGVIGTGRLVAAAAKECHDGLMGAAEAVLALRDPEAMKGLDAASVVRRAARWGFARPYAVEAALRSSRIDKRLAHAVVQCLADGGLPTDDAVVATCIELHPDTAGLLAAIEGMIQPTGERTRLAVARRYLAIGDEAAALTEVSDISILGPWGVESRAMACLCMHRMGRTDCIAAVLEALPSPALACRVIYRYGVLAKLGPERILALLEGTGFQRFPLDVLASVFDDAVDSGLPQASVAGLRRMVEATREGVLEIERNSFQMLDLAMQEWAELNGPAHTDRLACP